MKRVFRNELSFKNEPIRRNDTEMNHRNELEMKPIVEMNTIGNERRCRNEPMIFRRNERR